MKGAEEVGEALKGQESDPLFSDATHLSPPFLMAGRPARQQHFIWRMKASAYTMEEKKNQNNSTRQSGIFPGRP